MKSAKPSSKPYSTCEDLRRLKACIADARRGTRNPYRAALNAIDSAALPNLEEELKQTSAAHSLVCHSVNAHLADQHSQAFGGRLAG